MDVKSREDVQRSDGFGGRAGGGKERGRRGRKRERRK